MKKTFVTSFAVAALAITSACGGGGGRPSTDEVADALTSESSVFGASSIPEESADCFAGVLVDSDLSDDTLNAIVEGDEDYEGNDEDRDELQNLTTQLIEDCAPETPEVPDAETPSETPAP